MRSLHPMPGNPWPHDMMITVEDHPHAILDLLWIREAWGLHPVGDDLPPLLSDTPTPVSETRRDAAPIAEWEDAWFLLWRDCVRHAGTPQDPHSMQLLMSSPLAPSERERVLAEVVGPSWDDVFDRAAFTDEYQQWRELHFERAHAARPLSRDEQPEWMALDRLIAAWEAGLTTIVEIPCRGTFSRAIGPHVLLVTTGTRAARESYREALALFR